MLSLTDGPNLIVCCQLLLDMFAGRGNSTEEINAMKRENRVDAEGQKLLIFSGAICDYDEECSKGPSLAGAVGRSPQLRNLENAGDISVGRQVKVIAPQKNSSSIDPICGKL